MEEEMNLKSIINNKDEDFEISEERKKELEQLKEDESQKAFLDSLENLNQEDIEKEEKEQAKHKEYTLIDVAQAIIDGQEDN